MALDIYTLATAPCSAECTPPLPNPGLHQREVSRCSTRSRGLKYTPAAELASRASATAVGRKCPRQLLTLQVEPQNETRGVGLHQQPWHMRNKCLLLYVTDIVCFFVTQQKLTDTNCILLCVCVCVYNPNPIWVGMYILYIYMIHFILWFIIIWYIFIIDYI